MAAGEATPTTCVFGGVANNRSESSSLTGVRFAYNAMENALPLIVEEVSLKGIKIDCSLFCFGFTTVGFGLMALRLPVGTCQE